MKKYCDLLFAFIVFGGTIFLDYFAINNTLYFTKQAEYFDIRLNTECKFRFFDCLNNGTDSSIIYNSYIRDDRFLLCWVYSDIEGETKYCDTGFFQGNTFYSTKKDNCSITNSLSNATLADCNYFKDNYYPNLASKNWFIFLSIISVLLTVLTTFATCSGIITWWNYS